MKKLFILGCFLNTFLANDSILTLKKESMHFQIFYSEQDASIIDTMSDKAEIFHHYFSKIFNNSLDTKKKIYLYPDRETFCKDLGKTNTPEWMVAHWDGIGNVSMVSPQNPGTFHTHNSILKIFELNIAKLILSPNKTTPHWLTFGITAYETAYNKNNSKKNVPHWQDLNDIYNPNFFTSATLFVEFIYMRWGRKKALELAQDYCNFKKILGISYDEFQEQCTKWAQNIISDKDAPYGSSQLNM
jgi:hypothetical protein